ncbi:hypothetical protein MMC18_002926 [Xylographa bjoerkii]|nr:hypothetical protein [Xylographa bjoerkii]
MPISTRGKRVLDFDITYDEHEDILLNRPVKAARKSTSNRDIRSFIPTSNSSIPSSGQSGTKPGTTNKPLSSTSKRPGPESKKTPTKTKKQIYKAAIAAVDETIKELDRKVKAQGPNEKYGVNGDDYAKAMAGLHLSDFEKSWAMSGYGDHKKPYNELDELMLSVIKRRAELQPAKKSTSLPQLPKRETEIDVGGFKTGRPNKQQRGWMAKAKVE